MCWKKMMPINGYPFPASHVLKSLQFSQAASHQTFTQKRKDLLGCDWTWAMFLPGGPCPWGLRAAGKGLWAVRWQMELHSCSFMLQQSFVLSFRYFPATMLEAQQLLCEYSSPFFFFSLMQFEVIGGLVIFRTIYPPGKWWPWIYSIKYYQD